ncbi:MAG: ATP-binding cassette domain-containing protein [Thermoanaerobaculia bacterium]
MNAIQVTDLKKTYAGGIEALRGISFEVAQGEVFALLGPNGAGKSTTMRILTTLSTPTGGEARVAGLDVTREGAKVRLRIGYVAQNPGVDQFATGRENLMLQGRLFRLPPDRLAARCDELLRLFGLEDAANRTAQTYSGGMKRRLDVAMGLIHQPEVLFLDEPTTGLDPESRSRMWSEIRRLAQGGLTILLTTHYLEEADQLARRLAIVDHGQIVAEGTPEQLKKKLAGDRVALELARPEQAEGASAALQSVEGVESVVIDAGLLYARVRHGARAIPTLVAALESAGFEVAEVATRRPSLDDVYLAATGHAYHADGDDKPARA